MNNGIINKRFVLKSVTFGFGVFALFAVGFIFGSAVNTPTYATGNFIINSDLLNQVKSNLDSKFVFWKATSTLPTEKELEYGMIKGYVDSYKDPYTVFMPPQEAKNFAENVQGSFGGVGMNVGMKDGNIVVIAPLKDSPAMKAGIKAGDVIVKVDGRNMLGESSELAVSLIRGQIDTKVTITVLHPNEKETKDITITRKEIKIPTIDTEKKNGVFVIKLYNFSAESGELFNKALNDFVASGLKHLVIDLRGNPGGYLESAVNIASFFLDSGKMVVEEKQGKGEITVEHRSKGFAGVPYGTKIVVLVDGGSASASEILAGALKDHKVAKVVGVKSFGKGSVQELVSLSDGSSLKVTIAKWFTPNGVNISESGITPDIKVEVGTSTPKNKDGTLVDIQLNKAIETVKK